MSDRLSDPLAAFRLDGRQGVILPGLSISRSRFTPMVDLSSHEAQERLGALVQRAAATRERVTISKGGQTAAVLVNAEEMAEMAEAIAIASYREAQADGDVHLIDHQDAPARLGLDESSGPSPI